MAMRPLAARVAAQVEDDGPHVVRLEAGHAPSSCRSSTGSRMKMLKAMTPTSPTS